MSEQNQAKRAEVAPAQDQVGTSGGDGSEYRPSRMPHLPSTVTAEGVFRLAERLKTSRCPEAAAGAEDLADTLVLAELGGEDRLVAVVWAMAEVERLLRSGRLDECGPAVVQIATLRSAMETLMAGLGVDFSPPRDCRLQPGRKDLTPLRRKLKALGGKRRNEGPPKVKGTSRAADAADQASIDVERAVEMLRKNWLNRPVGPDDFEEGILEESRLAALDNLGPLSKPASPSVWAVRFGIGNRALRERVKLGKLHPVKISRSLWRFPLSELPPGYRE